MKRKTRRTLAVILIVLGALLLWLAPEQSVLGIVLLLVAVVVELVGIALEKRRIG